MIGGGRLAARRGGEEALSFAEGEQGPLLVDRDPGRRAGDASSRSSRPARAIGIYEGGLVPVDAGSVLLRFRATRIVVATGAIEQPLVFPGNDLVGVMLPDGVRRLIRDFALKPGERAVVLAGDDRALAVVDDLEHAGVDDRGDGRPARATRPSSRPRDGAAVSARSRSTACDTSATS